MIAIIDYDAGNIKSVEKALAYIGEEATLSRETEKTFKQIKRSFRALELWTGDGESAQIQSGTGDP